MNTAPEQPHDAPPGFRIREATLADVGGIIDVWYASFNRTHRFFDYATPDTPATRKWFEAFWTMGIEAGPTVLRTFVVEDLDDNNTTAIDNDNNDKKEKEKGKKKIVAFSRWHVPQADGNQDIPAPPFPDEWDPEISEALWGGMARSRERVMGKRPHWSADFVAVHTDYQNRGLAVPLVEWARRQAIASNVPMYADASMDGLPVWRHYGIVECGLIEMPRRPETYGSYEVVPIYWEPGMSMGRRKGEGEVARL
ncbi:hypothetical protein F5Y17DRAFT_221559 [Xylariaceae sp. FL0594]|nr:hypothetical protein F5Y17DRAFT_221559 [Xylariaceae sp. FL0594]